MQEPRGSNGNKGDCMLSKDWSSSELASGGKVATSLDCSTLLIKGQRFPVMAEDHEDVVPTMPSIALTKEQYKTLLEDVRNTQNSSCTFGLNIQEGEASDFRMSYPAYQGQQLPQQYHGELPTSSSPQPAYPQNIPYSSTYSPGPAHQATSISPITTQAPIPSPYGSNSSYSEASTPLTPSPVPYPSHLPTIPSTTEYPGDLRFQISFGPPTESASKSATWTFSEACRKLYVNLASFCPIKFKTSHLPFANCYIRAVAVFKGSTNLHDIVKRCPNHMENSNDGSAPNNHFIRSNNNQAKYQTCPDTLRHSVTIPYNGPQVGTEYVTEMFSFMCFSSCASGPSRRPVEIIFTLEREGVTLGRRVVEIRVCACPGRDRKSDEKAAGGEPSSSQSGKRSKRGQKGQAKRRRGDSKSQEEYFMPPIRNKHIYDILMSMHDQLTEKFEIVAQEGFSHASSASDDSEDTDQPSTSGTSVFKKTGASHI